MRFQESLNARLGTHSCDDDNALGSPSLDDADTSLQSVASGNARVRDIGHITGRVPWQSVVVLDGKETALGAVHANVVHGGIREELHHAIAHSEACTEDRDYAVLLTQVLSVVLYTHGSGDISLVGLHGACGLNSHDISDLLKETTELHWLGRLVAKLCHLAREHGVAASMKSWHGRSVVVLVDESIKTRSEGKERG